MTDEDRTLLEMAARAARLELVLWHSDGTPHAAIPSENYSFRWNPLTDDGPALQLAAQLEIDVLFRVVGGARVEAIAPGRRAVIEQAASADKREEATRRAIVRAAAQIGMGMSNEN